VTGQIAPPGETAEAHVSDTVLCGPIIVLTYEHSGVELLSDVLSASCTVACTDGTGLLPLCHLASGTWRSIENGGSAPSALAVKSIRSLVSTMAAVVQSRAGATRWCEIAYAGSAAAGTFRRIFPEATFICLHRSLRAVFADGMRAYPWGLGGSPFWGYAVGHPGNNVATIAEYWVAHTQELLVFEYRHPECSLRVRHEDLIDHPERTKNAIYDFLGLDPSTVSATPMLRSAPDKRVEEVEPAVQLAQLPSDLRAKIEDLHVGLGYPELL